MAEKLRFSRDIAAPPEVVYAAISDVTRIGEWSEECYACEWHKGFDGPVVGATFDGHNRHGDDEWTTQGKVIEALPGQAFAFECSMMDFHYSTWGYFIEPTETGCRVTEWNATADGDTPMGRVGTAKARAIVGSRARLSPEAARAVMAVRGSGV